MKLSKRIFVVFISAVVCLSGVGVSMHSIFATDNGAEGAIVESTDNGIENAEVENVEIAGGGGSLK